MKFVIAKPVAKMSVGDLFYSAPRKSEIDKACDELFQICLRRADREFLVILIIRNAMEWFRRLKKSCG